MSGASHRVRACAGPCWSLPQGLTSIDLSHNNLTGVVPSEIAYLENLVMLDLSANPSLGNPDPINGAREGPGGWSGARATCEMRDVHPRLPTLCSVTRYTLSSRGVCCAAGEGNMEMYPGVPTEIGMLTNLQVRVQMRNEQSVVGLVVIGNIVARSSSSAMLGTT